MSLITLPRRPRLSRISSLFLCAASPFLFGPGAHAQKESGIPSTAQTFNIEELPSWLKFDVELRSRTETQTAINFQPFNTQLYDLTRIRGGMTLQAPRYFSVYVQFHDQHALNLPVRYVASNMRDSFDFRQGYLRFTATKGSFIAGRQELRLGDERLIGISNWANNSRTYDVLHGIIGDKNNRLELFSGSVATIFPTSLDRPIGGFSLHGAYGTLTTLVPGVRLEPYVLLHTLPVTSQQSIKGREILVAPGVRATGKLPGGFDYNVDGTLERGTYVNDSIHAGGGFVMAGYTAKFIPWQPHLMPEYDFASGNAHRSPNRISTFDQFYPSNHDVFGLTDLFGWKNIKQRRINLDMRPRQDLYLLFHTESLHLASVHDTLYASSGSSIVAAPSGGFRSDDIGTEFDSAMQYVWRKHLVYELGMGHLWPGAALTQNKHNAPLTLAYFQLTYKFNLMKNQHIGRPPGQ